MTPRRQALSPSPRWPILATLAVAVLGLHLVLLAGGITLSPPDTRTGSAAPAPGFAVPTAHNTPDVSTAPMAAQGAPVVRASTVRWIVPAPAQLAEPSPRAKPAATAKPAPRAVTPSVPRAMPALKPVAMAPTPPSAPEPAAISAEHVVDPTPATPAAQALIEPTLPPEAPAQPTIAIDTPVVEALAPGETDDTLLAAAATAKPRATSAAVKLPPAVPPASTRLLYDVTGSVKGIGYKAQGTLDWTVANGRYDARMEMRVLLLGSRAQTSAGRIGPNGLMPERFADKSRSEKAAHFDATGQRITFSNNAPEAILQPGAQDRLSLFLQLASLLQARPQAYTAGQTIDMQVAGTGDAPIWRFDVGGESTISLPAGEFKVRRLVRQPRKEFDSTVEMWLAPSLSHLPVRLRVTQSNGDVADQQLSQMP